jgi:hypothetical protein
MPTVAIRGYRRRPHSGLRGKDAGIESRALHRGRLKGTAMTDAMYSASRGSYPSFELATLIPSTSAPLLWERQNLTMRMSMRRFTRLTNAFSKKIENHAAAVAIWFMYYNFCRVHTTLRVTPAMEAGISNHV